MKGSYSVLESTSSVRLALAACLVLTACSGSDKKEKGEVDAGTDVAASTASADWPSYGHDGLNTRYNSAEKTLTKSNVKKLVKKWDSATTGVSKYGVTSTPAVADGTVYF